MWWKRSSFCRVAMRGRIEEEAAFREDKRRSRGEKTEVDEARKGRWMECERRTSIGGELNKKTQILKRQTQTKAQHAWPSCLIFSLLVSDLGRSMPTLFEIQAGMKERKRGGRGQTVSSAPVSAILTGQTWLCMTLGLGMRRTAKEKSQLTTITAGGAQTDKKACSPLNDPICSQVKTFTAPESPHNKRRVSLKG